MCQGTGAGGLLSVSVEWSTRLAIIYKTEPRSENENFGYFFLSSLGPVRGCPCRWGYIVVAWAEDGMACSNRSKHVVCIKKWSRYRPGVAQRVGRGIALLFHDRGTRRGWVVRSTPRPHFTPWKYPVPILQEAGWASGPVWTGGKSRPHRDSIPDRPARSQSLYRLSYPAHYCLRTPNIYIVIESCLMAQSHLKY